MLEKFTEKAINVVTEAQNQAKLMQNVSVQPEHFLLALVKQARGISLNIFRSYNIDFKELQKVVEEKLRFEKSSRIFTTPPFSIASKELLKKASDIAEKTSNQNILYEHIFLAILNDKNSYVSRILEKFSFDVYKSKDLLSRLVQRKVKKVLHPESDDTTKLPSELLDIEHLLSGSKNVFDKALSKLSASNYEILGTEQILSSILEDNEAELTKILSKNGINSGNFEKKLAEVSNRKDEFEGKQIIFTPNAFIAMNNAIECAKELGSSVVTPTHLILGILKTKKGIAYNILNQLDISIPNLEKEILKPIENQMPETVTIMKLAKEEARRIGRNIVGTEMFLLGIISEGNGIGSRVLKELEVNIKDARNAVEEIIGYGDEYFDTEITFTDRAKKVLEEAWKLAKTRNELKIESSHLLYAITNYPDCVAMKVLEQLGADVIEIKQGIILEKQRSEK
ncbi:hypothetical protein IKE67_08395 [bacterium]|nr:hypothetical protein [bacterium]